MRGWHVAGKRQGLLDGADTWTQGVGGRRMLQRYVGKPMSHPWSGVCSCLCYLTECNVEYT